MTTYSITSTTLLDGLRNPQNQVHWRRFCERYVPMLLALAKRMRLQDADAQDVVGATLADFSVAYLGGKYDRAKGRLRDWLKGILRNQVSRYFGKLAAETKRREHYGQLEGALGGDGGLVAQTDDLESGYEIEWRLELLNQALMRLRAESNVDAYQAFDLYVQKQWPAKKVAEFLRTSMNAVYQAKSRSIARLKTIVAEIEREEE